MKPLRKLLLLTICCVVGALLLHADSFAQFKSKEVNRQVQSWFSVNSTTRLSKKFGVIADVHIRRNNFIAAPGFYFIRIGANYWLKENITVAVGYGKMWVAPINQAWHHFVQEKRLYQQIQISSKFAKISMLHRVRNEQRWQQKIINDKFINSYKFTDRIRYLASMNIPVFKNSHYPSLLISDELSIQFGKEIVYNTFDQNKVFIGIKQQISKSVNFDLGYMLVYQQKASGYQYDENHTMRCFFYFTPDGRKKK